jgi:hypothetical protein|tara:strand:- start:34 stop:363 length:330 start_codon:yes stop_codon:yes gene_type:complete
MVLEISGVAQKLRFYFYYGINFKLDSKLKREAKAFLLPKENSLAVARLFRHYWFSVIRQNNKKICQCPSRYNHFIQSIVCIAVWSLIAVAVVMVGMRSMAQSFSIGALA